MRVLNGAVEDVESYVCLRGLNTVADAVQWNSLQLNSVVRTDKSIRRRGENGCGWSSH